jgi:hypothetical protein
VSVLHQQYHRSVTTDLYRKCSCATKLPRQLPSWDWKLRCSLYTTPSVSRFFINFLVCKLCSFSVDKNYFISTFSCNSFWNAKGRTFRCVLYCIFKMEVEFPLSSIETLRNRLLDIVFQNTVIFRIITLRKSNKTFLLLLSVYKTFSSEAKTGFLDAQISCPTAVLVTELPFYFIIEIWNRTCTISKYSAVAAVQTCIQDVPYLSLDPATACRIYRFL